MPANDPHVGRAARARQRIPGALRVGQTARPRPFDYETVIDGRELAHPVNYALLRITPPPDHPPTDPKKRPFVVIDPRAGHGPGIGGFKIDSGIGVALKRGYPCYFVTFFPEPVEDQTIEAVCAAEIAFARKVRELHPDG